MKMILTSLLFLAPFTLFAQDPQSDPQIKNMNVPAKEISADDVPKLTDDGDIQLLLKAVTRQEKAFARNPLTGELVIGGQRFPMNLLKRTVEAFKLLVVKLEDCRQTQSHSYCQQNFEDDMKTYFRWYRPDIDHQSKAHFTGYYSPTFDATQTRTQSHMYGVYKRPTDESLRTATRNQILFQDKLEGQNLELFYLTDPFELYLLHIEGGGVVEYLEQGVKKQAYISYDGTNSQSFKFIGPYMKSQGYIKDLSIQSQRAYLKKNPQKWAEVYAQCPNFIYFQITKSEPLGMEGIPLTPGRSKAQDKSIFWRKGIMGFVATQKPVMPTPKNQKPKIPLTRFFIDQDTGGAIRGEARADLYFGYGPEAQFLAENLSEQGDLYFFLLK